MSKEKLAEMAEEMDIKITNLEEMPELDMCHCLAQPIPGGEVEICDGMFLTSAIHPNGKRTYLRQVSSKYHLEQHYNLLIHILEELGSLPEFGTPSLKLDFNGTGGCMWADFKFPDAINVGNKKKDDPLYPRIIVTNSADTKKRLSLAYGAWRLICSNGMMIPDNRFPNAGKISNLHKRGAIDIEEIVNGFKLGFQNFSEAIGLWKNYAKVQITSGQIVDALEVIGLSEKQSENLLEMPLRGFQGALVDRFHAGGTATAWEAYNAVTQWVTDETKNPGTAIDRTRKAGDWFDSLLAA